MFWTPKLTPVTGAFLPPPHPLCLFFFSSCPFCQTMRPYLTPPVNVDPEKNSPVSSREVACSRSWRRRLPPGTQNNHRLSYSPARKNSSSSKSYRPCYHHRFISSSSSSFCLRTRPRPRPRWRPRWRQCSRSARSPRLRRTSTSYSTSNHRSRFSSRRCTPTGGQVQGNYLQFLRYSHRRRRRRRRMRPVQPSSPRPMRCPPRPGARPRPPRRTMHSV